VNIYGIYGQRLLNIVEIEKCEKYLQSHSIGL